MKKSIQKDIDALKKSVNNNAKILQNVSLAVNVLYKKLGITDAEFKQAITDQYTEALNRKSIRPPETGPAASSSGGEQQGLLHNEGGGVAENSTPESEARETIINPSDQSHSNGQEPE